jgi:hypothetical protein
LAAARDGHFPLLSECHVGRDVGHYHSSFESYYLLLSLWYVRAVPLSWLLLLAF